MNTACGVAIVGACVVLAACSDLSDRIADSDTSMSGASGDGSGTGTGGGTSGTGTGTGGGTSGSGIGGHEEGPGGSEATGGSTLGDAESESGGMGGTGESMPPTCATNCQADGLICDVDTLTCICPPATPDHCPNDDVHCTNVMADDDDHCGDCATACPATSACNDGVCSALPEVVDGPEPRIRDFWLSGDTLYWLKDGDQVFSMAVTGGPVAAATIERSHRVPYMRKFKTDGVNLYAYDRELDFAPPSLFRIPLAGGSPKRIVHEGKITSGDLIFDYAVQAGALYYTVGNQLKSVPVDADDGTGTVVATAAGSEKVYGVAVDGSLLFWEAGGPLQPSASYNVEGDLISGGNRRTLATRDYYLGQNSLTTDGTSVYWAEGATLKRRVYDASTPQETFASTGGPQITAFAVKAATAYFISGDRVEKATFGGKPRAIARGEYLRSLVVGESGVYWTNGSNIMRADL
jgi:hypothetical protein